jgi:uncharacterized protein YhfF
MQQPTATCDECGSAFYSIASKMPAICPECAHYLYGYENCAHEFRDGRCMHCHWNGRSSTHVMKLKSQAVDPSVENIWRDYISAHPGRAGSDTPPSWHFCSDKQAADKCAELVVRGIKTATSSLLREYEIEGEELPAAGQYHIITDWAGKAKAVIRLTRVEQVPFDEVGAGFAAMEGEGDRSLDYWREVHRRFFRQLLEEHGERFSEDMTLVCEEFKVVWPQTDPFRARE